MNNIKPNSVNFSNPVGINSRDYYKGTSFRWSGAWESGKLYSNDTYFIDYVTYNNTLWVCVKSHHSSDSSKPGADNGVYWQKAARGAAPAVHVGPEPPTWEEYGDDFANVLWIDTSETEVDSLQVYSKTQVDEKFYNKEEIDKKLESIQPEAQVTKDDLEQLEKDLNAKIENIEHPTVDLEPYATKEELAEQIAGLATEEFVLQKIAEVKLEDPDIDLTGYATEDWVTSQNYLTTVPENYVTDSELEAYATKEEVRAITVTAIGNTIDASTWSE